MATPNDTTETLITEIKQRAMVPNSQKTYLPIDLLRRATQEMDLYIIPMILGSREEYFVYEVNSAMSGVGDYEINERAIGGVLRDLLVDYGTGQYQSIPYLDPDQRERANNSSGQLMFYLKWNKIVLVGSTSNTGNMKQVIFMRPGRFVETTEAAQITAINTGTFTVTIATAMPTTFIANASLDMISNKNLHAYKGIDQPVTSVTATDIVFTNALPTDLAVGDWISLAGESPLVQLPRELIPLLAQKVAVTIMHDLGDPKWKDGQAALEEMKTAAINLINPRVHGEDKIVVTGMNRNWWRY